MFAFIRLCFLALLALALPAYAATLEIQFQHTHGGVPLRFDVWNDAALAGGMLSISRVSYLLSGFALEKQDGGWVELPEQFAWIDEEQKRTTAMLRDVPAGKYRAVRFAVGLDAATNLGDPARWPAGHPLNPNLNSLHWTWSSGYVFLALEGHFRTGDEPPRGFSYHFARETNRTGITLPISVRITDDASSAIGVVFDVAKLLRGTQPQRDGDSTHSRDGDPIATALRANLPGAFSPRASTGATVETTPTLKPLDLPARFTPYRLRIGAHFPMPDLPRDNPLLEERVELGRRLFNEPLFSRNGRISCASCHDAQHAFADARRFSVGVEERMGRRNGMPLLNLAWKSSFFWDGRAPSLRAQALMPIQDHAEMDEQLDRVVAKLAAHPDYCTLFAAAFSSAEITPGRIGLAVENFLLTLTSHDAKFDRAARGQAQLTAEEKRGAELFFTEYDPRTGQFGADCFHCHGGALFTDHQFHNNGLGDALDPGRFGVTQRAADRGKFATPSLRNVALTAPYMHDGRFATLEAVVEHYTGSLPRDATLDPNLAKHPAAGLALSADDKRALIAFLQTLTDARFDDF